MVAASVPTYVLGFQPPAGKDLYLRRPRTWYVEGRIPSEGTSLWFEQLRWRGWGRPTASATGIAKGCLRGGGECWEGRVTLTVSRRLKAQTEGGPYRHYCRLAIRRPPKSSSLVGPYVAAIAYGTEPCGDSLP